MSEVFTTVGFLFIVGPLVLVGMVLILGGFGALFGALSGNDREPSGSSPASDMQREIENMRQDKINREQQAKARVKARLNAVIASDQTAVSRVEIPTVEELKARRQRAGW